MSGSESLPPTGSAVVYQRDHSWYARSHGGAASRFHFLGEDLASKCGRVRMLNTDDGRDVDQVPVELRCRAKGCRDLWPNAAGERPLPAGDKP